MYTYLNFCDSSSMDLSLGLIKPFVIIINIIYALLAFSTIALYVGILNVIPDDLKLICTYLLILSLFELLLAIFGWYSAHKEKEWFMWTYIIILIVTIIGHLLILLCSTIKNSADIEKRAQQHFDEAWQSHLNGDDNLINELQSKHRCCGKESSEDYKKAKQHIPLSCYEGKKTHAGELFSKGCEETIKMSTTICGSLTIGFTWATLGLEIIALFGALFLPISIKRVSFNI
ncbi:protein late bloomer-like [Anastrepha ludens]|uniref:protein late bloomer-like n=1 Tax=Anastrepha ludens TaxID=28586 RepID=UPI0023B1E7FC|nr:protein late bloomer-like [Anastrepha ludens]